MKLSLDIGIRIHIWDQQLNAYTSLSDPFNNANGGHFVCASVINNTFYLNDDSMQPTIINDISFIEKNVVLIAIKNEL